MKTRINYFEGAKTKQDKGVPDAFFSPSQQVHNDEGGSLVFK